MSEYDIADHTLVWAVHKDLDQAAVMPRSALHPNYTDGWSEVTAKDPTSNPKVQAALDAGTAAPAHAPTPAAPAVKEK